MPRKGAKRKASTKKPAAKRGKAAAKDKAAPKRKAAAAVSKAKKAKAEEEAEVEVDPQDVRRQNVCAVLAQADEGDLRGPECLFEEYCKLYRKQNISDNKAWARKALLNAVQTRDEAFAEKVLSPYAVVVRKNGRLLANHLWAKQKHSDDCHEEVNFTPPDTAFSLAVRLGDVGMAQLLLRYFSPTPKTNHKRAYAVATQTLLNDELAKSDLSSRMFHFLLTSDLGPAFITMLPKFAKVSLHCGALRNVRRALRYMLQLTTELDDDVADPASDASTQPAATSSAVDRHGVTPLHLQVLESSDKLDGKLNAKTCNAPGLDLFITPVHLAAASGNVRVLKRLLGKGGDPTVMDDCHKSALDYALVAPPGEKTAKSSGDDALDCAMRPSDTLLHLLKEPDMNFNRVMLESAARARRHHNVAYLVHFNYDDTHKYYNYNAEDEQIRRLIVNEGSTACLAIVLANQKFRNKLLRDKRTIDALLKVAVEKNRLSMAKVIVDDTELEASPDEVLLQTAVKLSLLPALKWLVDECHVAVDSAAMNHSALTAAVVHAALEVADFITARGARLTVRSTDDLTVLLHAARAGSIDAVEMLVSKGVSLSDGGTTVNGKEEKVEEKKVEVEEETGPAFDGWKIVLSGIFSVGKEVIKSVVEENGGKIQAKVSSTTTHCCYSGRDGLSDWGKKMGKGDTKYRDSKKKRLPFIDEEAILRVIRRSQQETLMREGAGNASTTPKEVRSTLLDVFEKGKGDREGMINYLLGCKDANVYSTDSKGGNALSYLVRFLPETDGSLAIAARLLDLADAPAQLKLRKLWEADTSKEEKKQIKAAKATAEERNVEAPVHSTLVDATAPYINMRDKSGLSPLHHAISLNKWKFLEMFLLLRGSLLHVNAPIPAPKGMAPAVAARSFGKSLLQMLVEAGRQKLVFMLLDSLEGDVNAVTYDEKQTPLPLLAVKHKHYTMALKMLQRPETNIEATDADGNGLLHVLFAGGISGGGRSFGVSDPVHTLAMFTEGLPKLDVDKANKLGECPIHLAATRLTQTTCVRHLLHLGAALDRKNNDGNSPLALAVLSSHEAIASFLADQGADFNVDVFVTPDKLVSLGCQGTAVARPCLSVHELAIRLRMESLLYLMETHAAKESDRALRAAVATSSLQRAQRILRAHKVTDPNECCRLALLLFSAASPTSWDETTTNKGIMSLARYILPRITPEAFSVVDSEGNTLVHLAVKQRHDSSVVAMLLDVIAGRGEDHGLTMCDNEEGDSQDDAAGEGTELPPSLVRARSSLDSASVSTSTSTPPTTSSKVSTAEAQRRVLRVLLIPDCNGLLPLHTAMDRGQIKIVRHLLSFACLSRQWESTTDASELPAEQLLLGNSFVDGKDPKGATPLHRALDTSKLGSRTNTASIALLRRFGADPALPDGNGVSVVQKIAKVAGNCFAEMRSALKGLTEEGSVVPVSLPAGVEEQLVALHKEHKAQLAAKDKAKLQVTAKRKAKWASLQTEWKSLHRTEVATENDAALQMKNAAAGKLRIPLDSACPSRHAYEVYVSPEGDIWDVMLQDTNISAGVFGRNAFHTVQLATLNAVYNQQRLRQMQQSAGGYTFSQRFGLAKYQVLERWGRQGDGHAQSRGYPFNNLDAAKKAFNKAFSKCTGGGTFDTRRELEPQKGAYTCVHKHYNEIEDVVVVDFEREVFRQACTPGKKAKDVDPAVQKAVDSSSLAPSVLLLLKLITNLTTLRADLQNTGYDTQGDELTCLGRATIAKAYVLLGKIDELVRKRNDLEGIRGRAAKLVRTTKYDITAKIRDLSNQYYSTVPHHYGTIDSGLVKITPIESKEQFTKEMSLLRAMEDVEHSLNLIVSLSGGNKGTGTTGTAMTARLETLYPKLGVDLKAVLPQSAKYKLILKYVAASGTTTNVRQILRVTRWEDDIRFAPFKKDRLRDRQLFGNGKNAFARPRNMLLWHGTKISNALGVLMQGLRIAPPEAPITGSMFGRGLYFADTFRKSSGYTMARSGYGGGWGQPTASTSSTTSPLNSLRVMFLCEVALGECLPRLQAEDFSGGPEAPFDTVQGCGRQQPSPHGMFVLRNGVGVPMGTLVQNQTEKGALHLNYNEFIIYDEARVKIRYAVVYE